MPDYVTTVLVPTYNHERYIGEAIESIRRQTVFRECIVIISDDGSTDKTFDVARRIACESNIVIRRNQTNLGVMRHYAELVSGIETPFTAILEGDDLWLDARRLESMLQMLKSNARMGMCFSACIVDHVSSGIKINHPLWNEGRNLIMDIIDLLRDNPIASFSNCIYRTQNLKRALLSRDGNVGYDWLCNMIIALTADIGFFAHRSTLYRVHKFGQWSGLNDREKNLMICQSLEAILRQAPDLHEYIKDEIRRRS
jgi:glycosyltransferase involved in cell wall biosynthesis